MFNNCVFDVIGLLSYLIKYYYYLLHASIWLIEVMSLAIS